MSGMDRLSDADVEWHAAHGAPLSAAMARELLAHRRASQAAPAASDGLREAVWNAAYLAGFMASGEGWNGEYPFSDHGNKPEDNDHWLDTRDEVRAALSASPAQEGEPRHD